MKRPYEKYRNKLIMIGILVFAIIFMIALPRLEKHGDGLSEQPILTPEDNPAKDSEVYEEMESETGEEETAANDETEDNSASDDLPQEVEPIVEMQPTTAPDPSESAEELVVEESIPASEPTNEPGSGKLIVIDAGHQAKGNSGQEPIGPGAKETKPKVSSGTTGVSTGLKEYELNLTVALKLKEELLDRGYQVLMIRETHDVDMSNSERAAIANEANADAFLRIHANGSDNSKVNGVMTICQTKSNPYNSNLYKVNRKLSDMILEQIVMQTKAANKGVWETDTMSGINWCTIPVTIIEMGYMSNKKEDELMATDNYQDKIVKGISDGLDEFFKER